MKGFSGRELEYLRRHEVCRLATSSRKGGPHVVPVIYAMDGDEMVIAVDYGTRKLANLRENPRLSLSVDEYARNGRNSAVVIQGGFKMYERGEEYRKLLKVLMEQFDEYRNDPWKEGECPIMVVVPEKVFSWGL